MSTRPQEPDDHVERTRAAYGNSARQFAASVGTAISADFEAPIDQALLHTFAEIVRAPGGSVVDAGCGTGRVARFLADRGLDVTGIDVAPGMIDEARAAHPDIGFVVAPLHRLPFADGSVGGIAYWYSVIRRRACFEHETTDQAILLATRSPEV